MIFAVLNQKGGVGKTTTAVTLAAGLARRAIRVLLMDLDGQGNCADALGVDSGPDLYKLLIDNRPLEEVAQPVRENLWLVRSDKNTLLAENIVQGMDFREYILANALENYPYDVVILDCAPSAHVLHTGALVASDYLIVPAEMVQLSIKGIVEVQRSLTSIQRMTTSNCQMAGIIPTKYDRRDGEHQKQLENLTAAFHQLVWSPIPVDAKCEVAHRKGQTLWEYAPNTRALVGWKDGAKHIGGYGQILEKVMGMIK